MRISRLSAAMLVALPLPALAAIPAGFVSNATPQDHITVIDPALYNGSYGSIKFNDWGYTGPGGVGASCYRAHANHAGPVVGRVLIGRYAAWNECVHVGTGGHARP